MIDIIAERFRNCVLQELLVDLQTVAIDRDYLRAVEVERHYSDQD
jgi:hypothetical protein